MHILTWFIFLSDLFRSQTKRFEPAARSFTVRPCDESRTKSQQHSHASAAIRNDDGRGV